MSNWKTDFEVKFKLEFIHVNGRKEIKNNTINKLSFNLLELTIFFNRIY